MGVRTLHPRWNSTTPSIWTRSGACGCGVGGGGNMMGEGRVGAADGVARMSVSNREL